MIKAEQNRKKAGGHARYHHLVTMIKRRQTAPFFKLYLQSLTFNSPAYQADFFCSASKAITNLLMRRTASFISSTAPAKDSRT